MVKERINILSLLKENKTKTERMFGLYDPLTANGSQIPRRRLDLNDSQHLLLPIDMFSEELINGIYQAGSVKAFTKEKPQYTYESYLDAISEIRMGYDFEFWAYTCAKIQDKLKKIMVPFVLRFPQRRLLAELEKMRLAGVPIRLILLKARQWGGSTLIQIYMAWIQLFHRRRWHSAVVAEDEGQARNIRGMFTNLSKEYPAEAGSITFRPYEGSTKNRLIHERDCVVGIGSAQKPDNLRSYDFAMLHLSETGIWKETAGKSPEDLVQSIRATVAKEAYTLIVLESTAKGTGNFFHREWISATKSNSGYLPMFVAWFEIDIYRKPLGTDQQLNDFVSSWSDYEKYLWDLGATIEGIHWYRNYMESENYSHWRMMEEFPSTAEEAFQSTGRRYFKAEHVRKFRKLCTDPIAIGDLYADGLKGEAAFKNIVFEPKRGGELFIWKYPHDPAPEIDEVVTNRYCGFADIGGKTAQADYSVLTIFDRYWMMEGGVPERVCTWRGHIDQDLVAWKFAQIAYFYDQALLAIERNSLRSKGESTDGTHHLTILNEIVDFYPNLYARDNPDKVREGRPLRYGFHTGAGTKEMILNKQVEAVRDDLYYETDIRACNEMDYFEIKDDGRLGAKEGQHDDILITTAGCSWLALQYMEPPQLISAPDLSALELKRKTYNHATV